MPPEPTQCLLHILCPFGGAHLAPETLHLPASTRCRAGRRGCVRLDECLPAHRRPPAVARARHGGAAGSGSRCSPTAPAVAAAPLQPRQPTGGHPHSSPGSCSWPACPSWRHHSILCVQQRRGGQQQSRGIHQPGRRLWRRSRGSSSSGLCAASQPGSPAAGTGRGRRHRNQLWGGTGRAARQPGRRRAAHCSVCACRRPGGCPPAAAGRGGEWHGGTSAAPAAWPSIAHHLLPARRLAAPGSSPASSSSSNRLPFCLFFWHGRRSAARCGCLAGAAGRGWPWSSSS